MEAVEACPAAVVRDGNGPLAESILSAIRQHGHQPFILVRIDYAGEEILICPSQNERLGFADTLVEASDRIGVSYLLDALRHGLRYEVYEAAFALFNWAVSRQPGRILVFDAEAKPFPKYYGHPIYDLYEGGPEDLRDRGCMLKAAFRAYEATNGNYVPRLRLIEAFGFALSRFCGLTGEYEEGLDFIDRVRKLGSRYVHLRSCSHALDLKRRGLPVPLRLEKFVGHDSGALGEFVCSLPFKNFDVTRSGQVRNCCKAPLAIGNVETHDIDEVVNSKTALGFRQSVLDGSYRYCDHLHCRFMIRNQLARKASPDIMNDDVMRAAVEDGRLHVDGKQDLSFAYDNSCNLSCPSCRREVILAKLSGNAIADTVVARLASLLPHIKMLYINPTGEFLVSKPSRRFLQAIDRNLCPDLKIAIISNGTLFTESEWNKFSNIHGMVHSVRISTDAALPDTFEKLRRGGKWDKFINNLRFLGRLRATNHIGALQLSFTCQVANFREMKDFVALSETVGADCAIFELLFPNSNAMTEIEYNERAVHLAGHPDHQEFLEIIADPIFQKNNVRSDFERPRRPT